MLKHVLAWAGIILLVSMYVITLIVALMGGENVMNYLMACVFLTILLPIVLWFLLLMIKNREQDRKQREEEQGKSDFKQRIPSMLFKRFLFLGLALFFLVLGCIGLLLPVIPQVPFLALGVIFLTSGSPRFRSWFLSRPFYKKYLQKQVRKYPFLVKALGDKTENPG